MCVWSRYDERTATEEVEKVGISKDDRFCDSHAVPLDAPLILLDRFRCLLVCFYLTLLSLPHMCHVRVLLMYLCKKAESYMYIHLPPVVDALRLRGDQRV